MIAVIDYGMGNVGSIVNMIKKVGGSAKVSSDPEVIRDADKLILPGVGSFDNGMRNLEKSNLLQVLTDVVVNKKKLILGICLGMHLMTEGSEEGELSGLGWLTGKAVRFKHDSTSDNLRIPHMGWCHIRLNNEGSLFRDLQEEPAFYFVHSYHVVSDNSNQILATAEHGYQFIAAMQAGNVMATQFHPEKSHKYGMSVMRNFVECNHG